MSTKRRRKPEDFEDMVSDCLMNRAHLALRYVTAFTKTNFALLGFAEAETCSPQSHTWVIAVLERVAREKAVVVGGAPAGTWR